MKDLKLLVKDYEGIAKNALTMLVNLSEDAEVLKSLTEDEAFLEVLLKRVTVCQWPQRVGPGGFEADAKMDRTPKNRTPISCAWSSPTSQRPSRSRSS